MASKIALLLSRASLEAWSQDCKRVADSVGLGPADVDAGWKGDTDTDAAADTEPNTEGDVERGYVESPMALSCASRGAEADRDDDRDTDGAGDAVGNAEPITEEDVGEYGLERGVVVSPMALSCASR